MPVSPFVRTLALCCMLAFLSPALAVPAEGTRIMISAPSGYAVDAGKAVADRGGNLIPGSHLSPRARRRRPCRP